jgi:hypothetical protein
MKVTKAQLQKIIQEELEGLSEQTLAQGATRMAPPGAPTDTRGDGTVASGSTRMADGSAGPDTAGATNVPAAGENQKLQKVAQQLQVLLKAIQQELQ